MPLTGLQPNTRYYYAVGAIPLPPPDPKKKVAEDAPGRASINSFVTPPPVGPAKPTRIWVLGDPGTKNAVQTAVRDVYLKFTGNRQTDLVDELDIAALRYRIDRPAEHVQNVKPDDGNIMSHENLPF